MGCCGLRCCFSSSGGEDDKEPLSKPKYSWDRDTNRPDRSLLIVSDQEGGVVGRLPGQLNGTQFKISNCKDTVVLVLDHLDSVIVDKCERCKIVLGPSRGSVFLRNCIDCVVVVACQQFRSRDCKHCHIFLHCISQPVVESCTRMKFSCFQCHYPQLKGPAFSGHYRAGGCFEQVDLCSNSAIETKRSDRSKEVAALVLYQPEEAARRSRNRVLSCKHCTHSHNQLVQSPITGLSCLSCPAQFTSAKLSVFNNQWSAVHDFTKDLEDGNWSVVLDDAPDIEVTGEEFGEVGLSFSREQSVVPHTTGLGQKASGSGEMCLVAFFSQDDLEETALAFVGKIQGKAQLMVTRQAALNGHQAESLFSGRTELVTLASKGVCILLEVSGQDCTAMCQQETGGAPKELVYMSPDPQQGRRDAEALTSYINISLTM